MSAIYRIEISAAEAIERLKRGERVLAFDRVLGRHGVVAVDKEYNIVRLIYWIEAGYFTEFYREEVA